MEGLIFGILWQYFSFYHYYYLRILEYQQSNNSERDEQELFCEEEFISSKLALDQTKLIFLPCPLVGLSLHGLDMQLSSPLKEEKFHPGNHSM